jgi:hypothetical protein
MTTFGHTQATPEAADRPVHQVIVVLYTVTAVALGAALAVLGVMLRFHRESVRIHERRAVEAGEP